MRESLGKATCSPSRSRRTLVSSGFPLLPGLAWAWTQIGLPTIPRIPEFQPETTVPSWGFAVPGFAATVLGFLIGVEFLSERFLFNMLSRARRWRNPVRYDEAPGVGRHHQRGPKST